MKRINKEERDMKKRRRKMKEGTLKNNKNKKNIDMEVDNQQGGMECEDYKEETEREKQ